MAHTDTPVPADRMAVFEIKELPGRASMIDCAFFLGSSAGTLEAYRMDVSGVVSVGKIRGERVGRSFVAPRQMLVSIGTAKSFKNVIPAALLASRDAMFELAVWMSFDVSCQRRFESSIRSAKLAESSLARHVIYGLGM